MKSSTAEWVNRNEAYSRIRIRISDFDFFVDVVLCGKCIKAPS